MFLSKNFVLLLLMSTASSTMVCMENNNASHLMLLMLPWIDKHEMVQKAIHDANSSKTGILKISHEGIVAEFRAQDAMVFLSSTNVSQCMEYSTFLNYLGIEQKQIPPPTSQPQSNAWCITQ